MIAELPDGASEFVVVLAILSPIAVAWVSTRTNKRNRETIEEVRDQVSHTDETNLRDDVDAIRMEIRGTRGDIGFIRGDVQDLRDRQLDFETGVRAYVNRIHPDDTFSPEERL